MICSNRLVRYCESIVGAEVRYNSDFILEPRVTIIIHNPSRPGHNCITNMFLHNIIYYLTRTLSHYIYFCTGGLSAQKRYVEVTLRKLIL